LAHVIGWAEHARKTLGRFFVRAQLEKRQKGVDES
jgi:hypothetical protein